LETGQHSFEQELIRSLSINTISKLSTASPRNPLPPSNPFIPGSGTPNTGIKPAHYTPVPNFGLTPTGYIPNNPAVQIPPHNPISTSSPIPPQGMPYIPTVIPNNPVIPPGQIPTGNPPVNSPYVSAPDRLNIEENWVTPPAKQQPQPTAPSNSLPKDIDPDDIEMLQSMGFKIEDKRQKVFDLIRKHKDISKVIEELLKNE